MKDPSASVTENYKLYCLSQNVSDPESMKELDRKRWPGGVMTGFILWMSGKRGRK